MRSIQPFLTPSQDSFPVRRVQPAQAGLGGHLKTVGFSGLRLDVFELSAQRAKGGVRVPHFGSSAWPGPEKAHIDRAKLVQKQTNPEDAGFYRAHDAFISALPDIIKLQKELDQPLSIVIDGDYRGKDAASLVSLLHAETGDDYEALAKKFRIIRRDVHPDALGKGFSLNERDQEGFETLLELDEKKYKPVIEKLKKDIQDPGFKKALGVFQQVDIADPTLPMPSAAMPSVGFAMQILHYLRPAHRLDYVRNMAKTQTPGSLLVLGTNEAISESILAYPKKLTLANALSISTVALQAGARMERMVPMHQELEKLGYKPVLPEIPDITPENQDDLLGADQKYIYKKMEDLAVPARDPKIEALIHSQALKEHPEFAVRLSKQDFDVHKADPKDGQTLLHRSVDQGLLDVSAALLDAGAKVHAVDGAKQSPWMMAQKSKNKGMIKLLKRYR